MLGRSQWLPLVAGAVSAVAILPSAVSAQGADFFKGRTVTYIVATAPGGGYDTYGRLTAEYMHRNLPGSTFVVKNMPGAGHLIGANAIYASKPDGLTIGTFNTGLIYNQLVKLEGVKFDLTKMSWIGKAASDPRSFVISSSSPIKSFEDLLALKEPVNFSTAGVGSAAYVETKMLTDAMNLPIKIITGYNGNDDQMAMRRGEITGVIGSRSSYEDYVKNGYGKFIAMIGGKDPSIPQVSSFAKDADSKALIALIQSQGEISRLTAGPAGIPAPQLAALREAFGKAMQDPELQAKAVKADRPIDSAVGDDVAKMVMAALNQPPKTIDLLKDALSAKPAALTAKGAIEAQDKGRKVILKGTDGKTLTFEPSGSRTKITVAGKEGTRDSLKSGQTCEVTYAQGSAEPSAISCQ